MHHMRPSRPLLVMCLLLAGACGPRDSTSAETRAALERGRELARIAADSADSVARWAATMAPRPGDPIDSALTPEEHRRRFRAQYGDPPEARSLAGGATTRETLVRQFVRALATRDSVALAAMQLSPIEFLDLYYPVSRFSRPPYEMSPQLAWMQITLNSDKGLVRLLRRVSDPSLRYEGHRCPDEPTLLGGARVWDGCTVTTAVGDGAPRTDRLFGGIFEHEGQFKFLGYPNSM
jgi:hypothetical protein